MSDDQDKPYKLLAFVARVSKDSVMKTALGTTAFIVKVSCTDHKATMTKLSGEVVQSANYVDGDGTVVSEMAKWFCGKTIPNQMSRYQAMAWAKFLTDGAKATSLPKTYVAPDIEGDVAAHNAEVEAQRARIEAQAASSQQP